jgi:hypothetical protein
MGQIKLTEDEQKRDWHGRFVKGHKGIQNSGNYKKGCVPYTKIHGNPNIRRENHYKWKGGNHGTARTIAIRDYHMDLSKCWICGNEGKAIHHIDENSYNNEERNLSVLCHFCHNAMHQNLSKRKIKMQEEGFLNEQGMEVLI